MVEKVAVGELLEIPTALGPLSSARIQHSPHRRAQSGSPGGPVGLLLPNVFQKNFVLHRMRQVTTAHCWADATGRMQP
jgi:hypothetical protein